MTKKKIGLDLGHGEDTFNRGSKGVYVDGKGYEEHHFNSMVGLKAKARLIELGFDVVMAQGAYELDIPLRTRTNIYDAKNVDVIFSIHANAGAKLANGMGVFHWYSSVQGKKLAEIFAKQFVAETKGVGIWGNNGGVWKSKPNDWSNFHMCRVPEAPSVLLELGFMTNTANDFKYLFGDKKEVFTSECAEAIVKTSCEYFGVTYHEKKKDAPVVTVTVPEGYKIQRGDTFYSIARDMKVSVPDLQKANPKVDFKTLQIGSYIQIPKAVVTPVAKPAVKPVVKPKPVAVKPDMKTDSIVKYLDSIKVSSSFTNRSKLAIKHGISGYKGTASQNLELLEEMRNPKPKGDQKTDSIVKYLESIGVDSSFANRSKLATKHKISGYKGTASQNTQLLGKIRGH